MELQDFIKNTLVSIANGVREANQLYQGPNKNPFYLMSGSGNESLVVFDVAVTVSKNTGKAAGGGIGIKVANIGGKIDSKQSQENVSRVKFQIRTTKSLS